MGTKGMHVGKYLMCVFMKYFIIMTKIPIFHIIECDTFIIQQFSRFPNLSYQTGRTVLDNPHIAKLPVPQNPLMFKNVNKLLSHISNVFKFLQIRLMPHAHLSNQVLARPS